MLNGQRLNDPVSGGALTISADIPLHTVKQIEIIRGPGSALYGANAFMALINIITDENGSQGLDAHLQGGNAASLLASINYGLEVGEFHVDVSAGTRRREHADVESLAFTQFASDNPPPFPIGIPFNATFSGNISNDFSEVFTVSSHLGYKGFSAQISYEAEENRNSWGSGVISEPVTDPLGTWDLTDERFNNRGENTVARVGLFYGQDLNDRFSWNASITFSDAEQDNRYIWSNFQHLGILAIGEGRLNGFKSFRKSQSLTSDWSLEWRPREDHSLVAGYSYQRDDVDRASNQANGGETVDGVIINVTPYVSTDDFLGGGDRTVHALYGQYTWQMHEKAAVTAGVRADDYSDFGSTVNPRLAFVYALSKLLSIKALYGQAFRAPTFLERTEFIAGGILPNLDLEPEEIQTFEFQFNFKPREHLRFSISGYSYEIENVIRQVSTNNPDANFESQFQNAGTREGEGLELEARYQTTLNSLIYLNYSKAIATDINNNSGFETSHDVEGVPKDSLNLGIIREIGKHLVAGVSAQRRWNWTPQPVIPFPNVEIPGYGVVMVDFLQELQFPDYTNVNVNLSISGLIQGLDFIIDAENILDEQFTFADQHSVVPGGITTGGRVIQAGVRYKY